METGHAGRATHGARLRVLIVDDDADSAEMFAALLHLMGHTVTVCHDGLAAVRTAGETHPDVVLLDIGLPDLDGYQVARRIRGQQHNGPLTLVAITGWGDDEDLAQAKDAGFDRHLLKPVDPDEFTALIADLARERGARQ